MLLFTLLSCVLDPSPGLYARFEVAPVPVASNTPAGSVTQLSDGAWIWIDGTELVTLQGDVETRHTNVAVAHPDSLRPTGPNSAIALSATGVIYTGDSGASFTDVVLPVIENVGGPRGVLRLNKERVVVGPENASAGLYWYSEDGGATFTEAQFPTDKGTIVEVRSMGTHLLLETVTGDGTHLYRWNPAGGSVDHLQTNTDNTLFPLPTHSTQRGTLLRAGEHPWRVDGLAPLTWTTDVDHLERPWEWGAVHAGGQGNNYTLIGLTHDDRVMLGGQELRVSALGLDDPNAKDDLFAGPRCHERYRLRPRELDDNPSQVVNVTNNTGVTLVPVSIQARGTWSQRYDATIAAGESVQHQGPVSGGQSWFLMFEGLEDGRCYGVWELQDTAPESITVEPAR